MGSVYRARDHVLGQDVALKVLHDRDQLTFLKREFRGLAQLSHPNLVEMYDLVVTPDQAFVTMELVDGVDVVRAARPGGELDVDVLRELVSQLVRAIAAIHDGGFVHRDIKPANVLVDRAGVVRVLDFGLVADVEMGARSTMVGTIPYMAPESFYGSTGQEADWYALGVLVYEMLASRLPFSGSLMEMVAQKQLGNFEALPDAPADLEEVITSWLAPVPTDRGGREAWGAERAAPRTSVFVGREASLARLRDVLSSGGIAIVSGPSGVGKSTLVQQAFTQVDADVLRSRCHPREAISFNAFDEIADALARPLAERVPPEIHGASALVSLFPVLAPLAVNEEPHASVDPRPLAASALIDLLTHRVAGGRVALFIDDAQWMDEDSRSLLRALVNGDAPVSLVLSCRDYAIATLLELLPEAEHIALAPLTEPETITLLSELGMSTAAPETLASAGGLPYLLVELAGQHGLSLAGVVERRLVALPDEARRLFELVCVAGRPLSLSVLRRAVGGELRGLARLHATRLVQPLAGGDDALIPYHDRLVQAYVARISDRQVVELHRSLADALIDQADARPADIVGHLVAAGDGPRAVQFAVEAAREAEAAHAYRLAIDFYQTALEFQDDAALREREAWCLSKAGRHRESSRAFSCAAILASGAERRRFEQRSAEECIRGGFYADGVRVVRKLLVDQGIDFPTSRGALIASTAAARARLRIRGTSYALTRDHEHELPALDALFEAATSLSYIDPIVGTLLATQYTHRAFDRGHPKHVLQGLVLEASHLALRGGAKNRARAQRMSRELHSIANEGPSVWRAWNHYADMVISWLEGDWDAATRAGVRLIQSYDIAHHGEFNLATSYYWYIPSLVLAGSVKSATKLINDRYAIARARHDEFGGNVSRQGYATLALLAAGQVEVARARADESRNLIRDVSGYVTWDFHQLLSRAWIALYTGAPALEWVDPEFARARRNGYVGLECIGVQLRSIRSRALAQESLRTGRTRYAKEALREARKIKTNIRSADAWRWAAEASARRALGQTRAAWDLLREATERFDASNMRLHATVGRWLLNREDPKVHEYIEREQIASLPSLAAVFFPGFGADR